jgi:hypothetical protein
MLKNLLFALAVFFFTGCIDDLKIEGNSREETEKRVTSPFSKIISEGDFEVTVENGDKFEIKIKAESNLLPYIETDIRGNSLHLFTQRFYTLKNNIPVSISVTMPGLSALTLAGSGFIKTGKFKTADFNIVLTGSGNIETYVEAVTLDATLAGSGNIVTSGVVEKAKVLLSGSGKLDGAKTAAKECVATISGSGNMWIDVIQKLEATIIGSGNLYYTGSPVIETKILGTGNVIKK